MIIMYLKGDTRQQATYWSDVDLVLGRHVVSLRVDEFMGSYCTIYELRTY